MATNEREWRGTLPASPAPIHATLPIAAFFVAIVASAGFVVAIIQLVGAGRHALAGFFPLALWGAWIRARRDTSTFAASDPRALAARSGELTVDGRAYRVTSAVAEDGWLRMHGPLRLSYLVVMADPLDAAAIVDALEVPDVGVRTIRTWSALAQVPVFGTLLCWAAPMLAVFATVVLLFAQGTGPGATMAFFALALASWALALATLARRDVRVDRDAVSVRWLRRHERHPFERVARLDLDGDAIVLEVRGAKPRRFRLYAPPTTNDPEGYREARAQALSRAMGPLSLARTGSLASVFE